MSDLRTFAEELEQTVVTPSFDVIRDRRRRRTRNRLILAGAGSLVALATAIGLSTGGANRAEPVPVQVPKVSRSDWLVLDTPFGLETRRVDSGLTARVVSKLDGDPHDASWSRQADRLVWVGYDDDATQDVWVADSRGAHARRLYDCDAPCKRARWARLSPDGGRVAVNLDLGTRSQLLVIDVATGEPVTLDLGGRAFEVSDWSADGMHLLGTLLTISGADSVADRQVVASLDVGGIRQGSTPQPRELIVADVPIWGAVWSPDGTKLAYLQLRDPESKLTDLYVAGADGSSRHTAWRDPVGETIASPSWALDGRHVFVSHTPASDSYAVLAKVDTATGTLTDLVDAVGNRIMATQLDAG